MLQLDDSVQKLVIKKVETLRDPDISLKRKVETKKTLSIPERRVVTVYPRTDKHVKPAKLLSSHANEKQLPAINLHQIEKNVEIPEFNQNHDNTSYATTNTVTRIVQTINQDTENVSETSSV